MKELGSRSRGFRGIAWIAVTLSAASGSAFARPDPPECPGPGEIAPAPEGYSPSPFRDGEVLRYRAHWNFIRLGTVVLEQHAREDGEQRARGDGEEYEVGMAVDSAPGLPFVDVHFDNRSILRRIDPQNRSFVFESRTEDRTRVEYRSCEAAQPLRIRIEKGGRTVVEEGVERAGPLYDADGLLMAIRCLARSGRFVSVPTIVDREIHPTLVRFTGEVRKVRARAFPDGVLARRVEAKANWATASCAGLTGRFWGWLTDDDRAIPVQIGFEIALGSVVLELESVTRPDPSGNLADSVQNAATTAPSAR